jgi:hypothetical protein
VLIDDRGRMASDVVVGADQVFVLASVVPIPVLS